MLGKIKLLDYPKHKIDLFVHNQVCTLSDKMYAHLFKVLFKNILVLLMLKSLSLYTVYSVSSCGLFMNVIETPLHFTRWNYMKNWQVAGLPLWSLTATAPSSTSLPATILKSGMLVTWLCKLMCHFSINRYQSFLTIGILINFLFTLWKWSYVFYFVFSENCV